MHALRLLWAAHNEEVWNRRQKRNNFRRCKEHIDEMLDSVFIDHFRLDKETFEELCLALRAYTSLRGSKEIPLEVKVLCTLSFLATGSCQRVVGITQNLTQRTTSRCIKEVVDALNHRMMVNKWIVFPQTHEERSRIRQEFQRLFNLPGVMGAIGCAHVAIVKPNQDEHLFYNKNGYHSINVQMVCDQNLRILSLNSKYGGATHNSFIWSDSQVETYMRGLHQNGEQTWLLGDSGYQQRESLMTPILDAAPGTREEEYTRRHIQAQNCIEQCFRLLKARWRCLLRHPTLHYQPHVASKIIIACCVLHNIALNAQLPPPRDVAEHLDGGDTMVVEPAASSTPNSQHELMRGRAMLFCLINRMQI